MSDKEIFNDTKKLENIYAQDCEFYRYMDNLKWGRFKTIWVIEGAIFAALYKEQLSPTTDIKIIILTGIIFVFLLSFLSFRDNDLQNRYLIRIKKYEENTYPDGNKLLRKITEKIAVIIAVIIINVANILLFIYFLE